VDDEKIFLLSLADGLNTSGLKFHILTAGNGEKALKALESESVDLVVTDLKMPVMDGFEFLSQMRKGYPDIPVIVISAFINPDVEKRLSSLGVCHYLEKPFDLEDLVNRIQRTW
jgi:CheY-like chemotaxis protein